MKLTKPLHKVNGENYSGVSNKKKVKRLRFCIKYYFILKNQAIYFERHQTATVLQIIEEFDTQLI